MHAISATPETRLEHQVEKTNMTGLTMRQSGLSFRQLLRHTSDGHARVQTDVDAAARVSRIRLLAPLVVFEPKLDARVKAELLDMVPVKAQPAYVM